ncbi:MAG TPA: glycosyltransferase family 4 protein [Candidatus Sulfotelmatobacter sp.]|nr:glycosyltransferase family 4 protein [Candidatus Sulfotelmatobacter sp.]
MTGLVGFVLKGYPRLSETFIAQEIAALEGRGLPIRIISLRRPTDRHRHPVHGEIAAAVHYLPEYLYQEPLRVLRAWWRLRRSRRYALARRTWLGDLRRDPTANRGRRFGQALVLAAEHGGDLGWLHAHFLHTPASVARYAAILCDLPFSISAHAKDIWTIPAWEKAEKLAGCRWAVTCTAANRDHLSALAPEGRVDLVYHGLDLRRFPAPSPPADAPRDGRDPAAPVRIVSVGRAVAKKGYDDLLQALAALPPELHWRFEHIGGGKLARKLARRAERLGLGARVRWRGARPQQDVVAALRDADLFVLASRIAGDGDRDGLPNVLMEAQSQGLCCLATLTAAIPELIEHAATGMLVPPADAAALAEALALLVRDPALRAAYGEAGQRRTRGHFGMAAGIDRLAVKFGLQQEPGRRLARQDLGV